MDLNSLAKHIKKIEVNTNNPTVIYSSIWQLKFLYKKSPNTICKYLFREIIKLSKKKDILIPAFINPKKLQNINIGKKKILTGYLAEYLAKKRSFYRTLNPFFSFLIIGPNKKELVSKSAKYEWGDGSLYDWLYKKNANIVTIGTHPTNCSFSHYAEQKMKNLITYRYFKKIDASFIDKKKRIYFSRNFFLRKKGVREVRFDFMLRKYRQNGMKLKEFKKGFFISGISAKKKIALIIKEIKKKPNCLIENNFL